MSPNIFGYKTLFGSNLRVSISVLHIVRTQFQRWESSLPIGLDENSSSPEEVRERGSEGIGCLRGREFSKKLKPLGWGRIQLFKV